MKPLQTCIPGLVPGMYWSLAALVLTAVYGLNSDSLWIDEGNTAIYALQPDLRSWHGHLLTDLNTDCQMPLTMWVTWGFAQVFGHSEVWLRAPNLLWGVLTVICLHQVGRLRGMPWLPLLMAVQPFYAFYTGEARPYSPQIAAGSVLLLSLVRYQADRGQGWGWSWLLAMGSLLAATLTLLSPLTLLPVYGAFLWVTAREKLPFIWQRWLPVLFTWILCLPLAAYYVETLLRGAKGTLLWSLSPANLGFIGYEILGCAGLGPPVRAIREAARSSGLGSLFLAEPGSVIALAVFVMAWVGLFVAAIRGPGGARREFGHAAISLAIFLATGFLFILVAIFLGKAFWARHLALALPFWVVGVAEVYRLATGPGGQRRLPQVALALIMILGLVSSLSLRFHPAHAKDDYRTAAQVAQQSLARGEVVWFFGSSQCAHYYGLPVGPNGESTVPELLLAHNPTAAMLAGPRPERVLYSKPDIYDAAGIGMAHLLDLGLEPDLSRSITAFSVWKPKERP